MKRLRALALVGRYRVTTYCALRMLQRGVEATEVRMTLVHATACHLQQNARWKVNGPTLTLVVEIQSDVVVVTLFRGDEDED